MEVVLQKLKDRITDKCKENTYNYNKHPQTGSGKPTGSCMHLEMVEELAVVDIDIKKDLDEEIKEAIRNELLEKLKPFGVIVQTAHGGLHVYCNQGDFYQPVNREYGCYTSENFDIDLLGHTLIEEGKLNTNIVMLPGSKGRNAHSEKSGQYKFIKGNWDSVVNGTIEEVFNALDIKVSFEYKDKTLDKKELITIQDSIVDNNLCEVIINGLVGLEIHRDCGGRQIEDKLTLFPLFASVNCLPPEYIDRCYEQIKTHCNLSEDAQQNFDYLRKKYKNVRSTSEIGTLIKIIKLNNENYYNEHIRPLLGNKSLNLIRKIDLKDSFNLTNIRERAFKGYYNDKLDKLITDLSRVLRFIEGVNLEFVIKVFKKESMTYQLEYITNNSLNESLKKIKIYVTKEDKQKKLSAMDVLNERLYLFSVNSIVFYDPKADINWFQGYKYETNEEVDMNLIQPYLRIIKEVICDNDETNYRYTLGWIATMMQRPGKKNEVAIILKGIQGAGKNTFTDAISEMLSGFSVRNLTNIDEISGKFNSVIEGKMLLVCNEMKNSGEDRMANFDVLKSIISDDTVRINEKMRPRHESQNVANLIFLTNNFYPVKIEASDRRYFVMIVNGRYCGREHKPFWEKLRNSYTPEFFKALTKYFLTYDLSGFQVRDIPITKAKQILIEVSRSPLDKFIMEHFEKFVNGILLEELKRMIDQISTTLLKTTHENFFAQVKDKLERSEDKATKKQIEDLGLVYDPTKRPRLYKLRADNIAVYRTLIDNNNDYSSDYDN